MQLTVQVTNDQKWSTALVKRKTNKETNKQKLPVTLDRSWQADEEICFEVSSKWWTGEEMMTLLKVVYKLGNFW